MPAVEAPSAFAIVDLEAVPTEATASLETASPGVAAPSVKDRWEARWRAAGAEIKARAGAVRSGDESRSAGFSTAYQAVPLKQSSAPTARTIATDAVDRLAARARTNRPAANVEPRWKSPSAEIPPRIAAAGSSFSNGPGREPKRGAFRAPDPIEPRQPEAFVMPRRRAAVEDRARPYPETGIGARVPIVPTYRTAVSPSAPVIPDDDRGFAVLASNEITSFEDVTGSESTADTFSATHESPRDLAPIEAEAPTIENLLTETLAAPFTVASQFDTASVDLSVSACADVNDAIPNNDAPPAAHLDAAETDPVMVRREREKERRHDRVLPARDVGAKKPPAEQPEE